MDSHLENKFLGKEKAYIEQYKEKEMQLAGEVQNMDDFKAQVYNSFVVEKDVLIGYVKDLISYIQNGPTGPEGKTVEILTDEDAFYVKSRIIFIISKYQEQPELLDPILNDFLVPLVKFMQLYLRENVKKMEAPYQLSGNMKNIFDLIYNLSKVRGMKKVMKFFPHDVNDLELLVDFLVNVKVTSSEWYLHYVLLLWLSMLVIVPFDLESVEAKEDGKESLFDKIINFCEGFLRFTGVNREVASLVLAKILTRPDAVKSGHLDSFIEKMKQRYADNIHDSTKIFILTGVLHVMTDILKTGQREQLISRIESIFDTFVTVKSSSEFVESSSVLKKLRVKFADHLGCVLLKPKVASWRYKMGVRSLMQTLENKQPETKQEESEEDEAEDDDEYSIENKYEYLETIITILLEHLKDQETNIRWAAAKGIGKITSRLPRDMADQILEDIIKCFDDNETDSSWQGGCLALAEFCRGGLLLPSRLEEIMPKLEKALLYDVNRGTHSIGSHVRDAACFVVWSFARSFYRDIMKPHVEFLSTTLCILFLFDREVNCRRAASATFQECVGRQRTFPHGIDILNRADYFTLANRTNSYLNVSCYIAQFEEYYEPLIDHLVNVKLQHWEEETRILAGKAVSVLCIYNPSLVVEKYLPIIYEKCFKKALNVKHGALWGLSELMLGLSGQSDLSREQKLEEAMQQINTRDVEIATLDGQKNNLHLIPEDLLAKIKSVVQDMEEKDLLKGKGGEIMRLACNHFIQCTSLAKIEYTDETLQKFQKMLEENAMHSKIEVQESTVSAYKHLLKSYHNNDDDVNANKQYVVKGALWLLEKSYKDSNVDATRGCNMMLGSLSRSVILCIQQKLLKTLLSNMVSKGKPNDDAESRKYAVRSILEIMITLGLENVDNSIIKGAIENMFKAIDDYALDKRGDVGSWVREESMRSLNILLHQLFYNYNPELLDNIIPKDSHEQFFIKYIGTILQQLMEKIDKIRQVAGQVLQSFLIKFGQDLPNFEEKDTLIAMFAINEEDENQKVLDSAYLDNRGYLGMKFTYRPWRNPSFVFNQIVPLFESKNFRKYVFTGIVSSSGGLTESTVKSSLDVLVKYISSLNGKEDEIAKKKEFVDTFNEIFEENLKQERITVPLMKTMESLLRTTYFSDPAFGEKFIRMHGLCTQEVAKTKNIIKLITCAGILGELLEFPDVKEKALRTLLCLLFNAFPKVRKLVSENLYNYLLALEDFTTMFENEDKYDEAIILLSETDWAMKLKDLNSEYKKTTFMTFGQDPPAPKKKQQPEGEQNQDGNN